MTVAATAAMPMVLTPSRRRFGSTASTGPSATSDPRSIHVTLGRSSSVAVRTARVTGAASSAIIPTTSNARAHAGACDHHPSSVPSQPDVSSTARRRGAPCRYCPGSWIGS